MQVQSHTRHAAGSPRKFAHTLARKFPLKSLAASVLTPILALILVANGIAMLTMPATWYAQVPGVPATGPLNLHFVRDIGCAYLVSGVTFLWLWRKASAWPAAAAGSAFLVLHALVHLGEALAGVHELHHLMRDIPGVFLIPVLAVWLVCLSFYKEIDDV